MPTRPKGIESAAHERGTDVGIRTNLHYVVECIWTASAVRSPLTPRVPGGAIGGLLHHSGGLFGQAQGKRSFEALTELLNIITAKLCNAAQGAVLTQF